MTKNNGSFAPGQSGNPNGRPRRPKLEGRPLASVLRAMGNEYSGLTEHRVALAARLWNAVQTGWIALEAERRLTLNTREWIDLVKWMHYHIDGELHKTSREEDWQAYQRDLPEETRYAREMQPYHLEQRVATFQQEQEQYARQAYFEARMWEVAKQQGLEKKMGDERIARVVKEEAARMVAEEMGVGLTLRDAVAQQMALERLKEKDGNGAEQVEQEEEAEVKKEAVRKAKK